MNILGHEPGAVKFGNFINYYQFSSAEERIKLLPTDIWMPTQQYASSLNTSQDSYLVLDVGCNAGNLTQLLQPFLLHCVGGRSVHVLGVDFDPVLIERAQEHNHCADIEYACVDVMDSAAFEQITAFLKQHNRDKFDVVCCFSITMWIHLNHDDSGLQLFLEKLSNLAELFVVEPQPWKCYTAAERRLRKSDKEFPLFMKLKWRSNIENDIQTYLEVQLARCKIYECCPNKWKRRICFYR